MAVFYCKSCGQKMRAAANVAGRQCRCKACNAMATIPANDEPPPIEGAAQHDEPPPLPPEDEMLPPPLPGTHASPNVRQALAPPPVVTRNVLIAVGVAVMLLVGGVGLYAAWPRGNMPGATRPGNSVDSGATTYAPERDIPAAKSASITGFDFKNKNQPNYAEGAYNEFKAQVDYRININGESPFEAAANVKALLGRQGDYDKLLATDPRFNSRR